MTRETNVLGKPRAIWICCGRSCSLVALLSVLLLLSSCETANYKSTTIQVSPTPDESITQTAQADQRGPVTVLVSVFKNTGTVASGKISLAAHVIIVNHTSQTIYLFQTCNMPTLFLSLTPVTSAGTLGQVRQLIGAPPCLVSTNGTDIGSVPSSGSLTTDRYADLYSYYSDWQPGTYVLTANVPAWHQGPYAGAGNDSTPSGSLQSGFAQGQTVIKLS